MLCQALVAALLSATALAGPVVKRAAAHNDFSCRSTTHPNPVVLLHGLGATYYEDLNYLEDNLKSEGWCTFSITYGAYEGFPFVGGLKAINESAAENAAFIREVKEKTGAKKIDLVGHSEGAFQSLYIPKFEEGISDIVERVFSLAPPTHGTGFLLDLYKIAYIGGNLTEGLVATILDTFGCPACNDLLPTGGAVKRLDDGPIAQKGIKYTVVVSKYDELIQPTTTSFINEEGVINHYVQDFCPRDPVGHIGEAYDLNVWAMVRNALMDIDAGPDVCFVGSPGK